LEPIEQLEEAVNAIVDPSKNVETHDRMGELNRKIRFPQTDGVVLPKARALRPEDVDFWGLFLGKKVLEARGAVLPEDYENRLAALSQKYTMTSGGTGTGQELTEVAQSVDLLRDMYLATNVMAALPAINMPSGKMKLSQIISDATFYKPSDEATAVTVTDLTTAQKDFIAYTLKAQVDISDELEEDSLVALLPQLRKILIQNCAQAIDEAILNADASTGTQNINYYAASGGSSIATTSRFLLGFDGLIHMALNEASGMATDTDGFDITDYSTLLGKLGKYAADPTRLAFIMDVWAYLKAVAMSDFRKVSDLGNQATLLTGQLGQVYGVPVIVSQQMAKANATGQVDQTGGNNTKSRVLLVHRDMWRVGLARPVQVRTERSESKTMTSLVASFRLALQCFGDRASATHTALAYNVS